jgi:hypothetical protein
VSKELLYEEKQKTYLFFYAIILMVIIIEAMSIVVQLLLSKNFISALPSLGISTLLLAAFTFVLLNFFTMKLRITEDDLIVSYGLFKLTIKRSDILTCEPSTFSWKTYLGWGIRPGLDGTVAWTAKGNKGIRLETKSRAYIISTGHAEKVCKILGG